MEVPLKVRIYYLPFILVFILCMLVIIVMSCIFPEEVEETINKSVGTKAIDWYIPKINNNEVPVFPDYVQEFKNKYKIIVTGKQQKTIYLTFNCGYEYENYTLDILNILKKNNIKAAFFITGDYLRENPDIVKTMQEQGHIVGNHGNTHALPSTLNEEEIRKEVVDFESEYKKIIGNNMEIKYYRPASGNFTEKVLEVADSLGYKTVFWSLAYKDWETNNQPDKEVAYNNITNKIHSGCILMLHTVSNTNKEILDQVISDLESKGYKFDSLDNL